MSVKFSNLKFNNLLRAQQFLLFAITLCVFALRLRFAQHSCVGTGTDSNTSTKTVATI